MTDEVHVVQNRATPRNLVHRQRSCIIWVKSVALMCFHDPFAQRKVNLEQREVKTAVQCSTTTDGRIQFAVWVRFLANILFKMEVLQRQTVTFSENRILNAL